VGKLKLNDRQVEELLKELPKLEDGRQPEEIYRNVAANLRKRRQRSWFMPALASAAAAALFFILSPGLGLQQEQTARQESSMDHAGTSTEMKDESATHTGDDSQMNASLSTDAEPAKEIGISSIQPTAVYKQDLETYEALTYAIPDANAQIAVPVTVLVEKAGKKNWFEQFEETMPKLTEEEWGLMDYYPLNAEISYDQASKTVNVDVAEGHPYGFGSAAETWFLKVLEDSLPHDKVQRVSFSTEGRKGIELGNTGEKFELPLPQPEGHAYLFYYRDEGEESIPYMVPANESFHTFSEALEAMAVNREELGLKASLPENFAIEGALVEENGSVLHLEFPPGPFFEESFMYSLEAIMLTAKSFGYEALKIDNADGEIGPFNLNESLELPVGANKKIIGLN
jgi:cytoskeletal protein RodZ